MGNVLLSVLTAVPGCCLAHIGSTGLSLSQSSGNQLGIGHHGWVLKTTSLASCMVPNLPKPYSHKSLFEFSETSPEFLSPVFSQSHFFGFLKFWILAIFFSFYVNMGPFGSQKCKTLLLPQIVTKPYQTVPEFFIISSSFAKFPTLRLSKG